MITEVLSVASVSLRESLSWSRRRTRVGLVYWVGITDVRQVRHGAPQYGGPGAAVVVGQSQPALPQDESHEYSDTQTHHRHAEPQACHAP